MPEPTSNIKEARTHSSDKKHFQKIYQWIRECQTEHYLCNSREEALIMPPRVLDLSHDSIRLVFTKESNEKGDYLTLSHCWGRVDSQPKTLRDNIETRKKGISMDELNQSYKDAVIITRKLGFRYLWIDSLCIVQDDPDDWEKHARDMACIFANSFLTICASHARDSTIGIFADRQAAHGVASGEALPNVPFSTEVAQQTATGERREVVIHARLLANHYYQGILPPRGELRPEFPTKEHWQPPSLSEEPLFGRARALQERTLAKRTLDYHACEMVWECQEVRRCECQEADRAPFETQKKRYMDSLYGIRVDNDGQSQRKDGSTLKLFHDNIWFDIVGTYIKLALTFREDRLPALAGLAEWIQASKNYRYYAGIWEKDLPNALLWRTPRESRVAKNLRTVNAPPWSWASMDGSIEYAPDIDSQKPTMVVATCLQNRCFQLEHRFTRCRKEPLQVGVLTVTCTRRRNARSSLIQSINFHN